MSQIALNIDNIKDLVKESVKEAIREERFSLYQALIPTVSKKEMEEIISECGNPKDYKKNDFLDISDLFEK